jgi:hypothetical protein
LESTLGELEPNAFSRNSRRPGNRCRNYVLGEEHDDTVRIAAAQQLLLDEENHDKNSIDFDSSDSSDDDDDDDQFLKLLKDLSNLIKSESLWGDDGEDDEKFLDDEESVEGTEDETVAYEGKEYRRSQCFFISNLKEGPEFVVGIQNFPSNNEALVIPLVRFEDTLVGHLQKRRQPDKPSCDLPFAEAEYWRLPNKACSIHLKHLAASKEAEGMMLNDWTWSTDQERLQLCTIQ